MKRPDPLWLKTQQLAGFIVGQFRHLKHLITDPGPRDLVPFHLPVLLVARDRGLIHDKFKALLGSLSVHKYLVQQMSLNSLKVNEVRKLFFGLSVKIIVQVFQAHKEVRMVEGREIYTCQRRQAHLVLVKLVQRKRHRQQIVRRNAELVHPIVKVEEIF